MVDTKVHDIRSFAHHLSCIHTETFEEQPFYMRDKLLNAILTQSVETFNLMSIVIIPHTRLKEEQ